MQRLQIPSEYVMGLLILLLGGIGSAGAAPPGGGATAPSSGAAATDASSGDAETSPARHEPSLSELRVELFDNERALARASAAEFRAAILAASEAGVSDRQELAWFLRWVEQTQALPDASTSDLAFVLDFLTLDRSRAAGDLWEEHGRALAKVTAVVKQRAARLADERDALRVAELSSLIRSALDAADERQREELSRAVASHVVERPGAEVLLEEGMQQAMLRYLTRSIEPAARQAVVATLMRDSENRNRLSPDRLASLYVALTPPAGAEAEAARREILERVSRGFDTYAGFIASLSSRRAEAAERMISHAEQRFQRAIQNDQVMSAKALGQVLDLLSRGDRSQEGRSLVFEGIARFIDRGGRIEGDFAEYRQLGRQLSGGGGKARLQASLVREDGGVRLDLAKLLAWMYSGGESIQTYRKSLTQNAEQSSLTGDQRAQWLLARAYAAQVLPAELSPVAGMRWVERAFAEARSESLRLECLGWMVRRWMEVREHERASSLLASVSHQFEQEASRQQIASLENQLADAAQRERVRQTKAAHRNKVQRLEGQIESMQDRLERMKQSGRADEDVRSVARIIHKLQQRLEGIEARP